MFGYVKIDKDELKVKDYNLFKACYCGVCQTLKREYGFPARYFLSYDVTFLAVMLLALRQEEPSFAPIRCLSNPAVRRPAARSNEVLSYAAAVNVLLVWFKLKDDWSDNRSLKAALLMPLMYGKRGKAKKRFPALYQTIETSLAELSALEREGCPLADKAAGAFGKLMAGIFDTGLARTEENRRILAHCGLLLGRFIYLLDAWEDKAEDEKKRAYNPFLLAEQPEEETFRLSLEYSLGELGASFALLKPLRYREILENIIYLGLQKALDSVFNGRDSAADGIKEKHHERPI